MGMYELYCRQIKVFLSFTLHIKDLAADQQFIRRLRTLTIGFLSPFYFLRAGSLVSLSGADPLNLAGILTPGRRVASIASNRVLLRDGVPVAALEAGEIESLDAQVKYLERQAAMATLRWRPARQ